MTNPSLEGTAPASRIRVAAAQFDPHLGDSRRNTARMRDLLEQAARSGAELVVFPECAVTGYNFASPGDARAAAEPLDGPALQTIQAQCRALKVHCVAGALTLDGGRLLNSAVLIGPGGIIGSYDKAHLPLCGADKFTDPGGTGFKVFDTPLGRIGMLICYDLRFPEAARALALRGADIIALPTNWPSGAETAPEFMVRARAFENRVFVVACNRVGIERGARYIGRSCIAAPSGRHLADASPEAEETICAEFDPAAARQKRLVISPGEFEMDFFGDRRPDLYA